MWGLLNTHTKPGLHVFQNFQSIYYKYLNLIFQKEAFSSLLQLYYTIWSFRSMLAHRINRAGNERDNKTCILLKNLYLWISHYSTISCCNFYITFYFYETQVFLDQTHGNFVPFWTQNKKLEIKSAVSHRASFCVAIQTITINVVKTGIRLVCTGFSLETVTHIS